jgi:DNA-binding transcriptional MerR regulator
MENRNYSQITFEFSDVPAGQETISSVGVGVRVKSLKAEVEPPKTDVPATEAIEATETSETADIAHNTTEVTGQVQVPAKKSTRGRKSLKALDAEADLVNIPDDETLFQRQYYSIGEVADMFGVNQSLLRFWENEFDIIKPRKNRKGDRHFRPVDIKNLELIYDLLRRRKLTIEGAKDFLKKNAKAKEHFEMIQSLQSLKGFLLEIKAAL